jgi:LmbE family N-acetylglucosaminyl deacetylase
VHAVSLGAHEPVASVLAIGCHADDIEIGCGATILSLVEANPDTEITWVVLGASGDRTDEARQSAESFLAGLRRQPRLVFESFRDGYFPYVGSEVKDVFERLKAEVSPDLVLTHTGEDAHQDHRLAAELTWNTFRNHLVLEFEIPKYDGDLAPRNVFFPITEERARRKTELLRTHFASQRSKHWFTDDLFLGLMRVRGMEANSPTGYAEAFTCRKLQLLA